MAISTAIKNAVNRCLAPLNLRVDSLTASRQEKSRLQSLQADGWLESLQYREMPAVDHSFLSALSTLYQEVEPQLTELVNGDSAVGFSKDNNYFLTPDTEALYLVVRHCKPRHVVEIGAGNSTQISRQAVLDGQLDTTIISIDPAPRREIREYADEFIESRLEDLHASRVIDLLSPGDILFVDSSHEVKVGNDVVRIICQLLPRLPPGVLVHFHDIFLPYEYPADFAFPYPGWGEQYLLYAWLLNNPVRLLWPGYQLQKQSPETVAELPFLAQGRAQSFWFQIP